MKRWSTWLSVLAAGLLLLGLAPSVAAAAPTPPYSPPVPVLNWTPCDNGFQCATAKVPLDYRSPSGPTTDIAVIRHQATDPAQRVGTIFVNGGGPNEQLVDFLAEYPSLPADYRARFDFVDFDPRGFGYSTAIQCFPTMDDEQNFLSALPSGGFPVGAQEIATWEKTWADFHSRCAATGNPLLQHDSTADVARDMDLLRQAVGAPTLNYLGLSYGTGLGAIYANLFPSRVGRMVLDGNLDPVAWTTDEGGLPMFLRNHDAQAAQQVLRDYLDLCGQASTTACAFSAGSPAATEAKYSALLDRLAQHPVTTSGSSLPPVCGYACGVSIVPLGSVANWQRGGVVLQQLWTASQTGSALKASPADTGPYTGREQSLAVRCSDGPESSDVGSYAGIAQYAYDRWGPEGLSATWDSEECANWPQGDDAYAGPWNRPTAGTVLVIGNTGDPDTAYQNSVAMSRDLGRARLLTVNGYGHTEFQNPSACAANYEYTYFATGALPPAGTVCQQDTPPFP